MKYALAVNRVTENLNYNVNLILEYIKEAKKNHADFIVFPECCITGLINNDIPEHDLALGITENSNIIRSICKFAMQNEIYVSIGFLELNNKSLYDSTICIDNFGNIISKYRRMSDGWHGSNADKKVYKQGIDIATFNIENKKYSYLICGDLFDNIIVGKVRKENIDILIFPFARTLNNGDVSQKRWDMEEMPYYIGQISKIGAITLMVNYIKDSSNTRNYFFGGAFVVDKSGKIIAQKDIGNAGMLYFEAD